MKLTSYIAVLALLVFSAGVAAHDALPSPTWCVSGRAVAMGPFSFSGSEITAYANCLRTGQCVDIVPPPPSSPVLRGGTPISCPLQSCGQFDDDYGVAKRMAVHYCALYARAWTIGHVADWGTVIADVLVPSNFNTVVHHASYSATSGLAGMCVRCEDPYIGPPIH